MKIRRKSFVASCMVFLLFGMLLMPLPVFAEGVETPRGFVDPVSTLDMKRGDVNAFAEFWERLEEIFLVPYEANVTHFDSFLDRAANRRFHPVSAPPLVIKKGEILPEYRIDISYGPVEFTVDGSTTVSECSGDFVMKNIQFGNTEANAILYNAGGSCDITSQDSSDPHIVNYNILEKEDSYAAVCTIDAGDPATLMLSATGDSESQNGSPMRTIILHFRVDGVKLAKVGAASKDQVAATVDTRSNEDKGDTDFADPLTTLVISILAILLSILFGGTGGFVPTTPVGAGGTPAPAPAGGGLGRWLRFDGDGDIETTDPISGQKRTFVHNGDGTYTDPVNGATYTPEELSEQMEHRADNAETIRQDEAQFRQNVSEDSQRNQERSDESKQLEEDLRRERQERAHREKVERVAIKLGMNGAGEDDVKQELARRMEKDERFRDAMMKSADILDTSIDILEATVDIADYTMAAGEALGGAPGKAVSATYKGIKNIGSTVMEKGASVGSVVEGVIKGGTEAATTVMQAGVGKTVTTIGGTVAGEIAGAVNDGEDIARATAEGLIKGAGNATIGAVSDGVEDAAITSKDKAVVKVIEAALGKEVADPTYDKMFKDDK